MKHNDIYRKAALFTLQQGIIQGVYTKHTHITYTTYTHIHTLELQ